MQKQQVQNLVEETINSLDGCSRAEAKPFLLTRIMARLRQQDGPASSWTKIGTFLSRPVIAFATVSLILVINAVIIINNMTRRNFDSSVQNTTLTKDEFAINVLSIYDLENPEP